MKTELQNLNTLASRDLIDVLRMNATGSPEFTKLVNECADKIEDFLGGPLEDHVE